MQAFDGQALLDGEFDVAFLSLNAPARGTMR